MSTEVATASTDEVLLKKRAAYANLGEIIHKGEMDLQVKAQAVIQSIKLPAKIEDLPQSRILLAEVKKSVTTIEAARKEITGKFKAVAERLMLPEKSLADPIAKLEAAIITLTKQHAIEEQKKQEKINEAKNIVEFIKTFIADADHENRSKIGIMVSAAYEHALGKGAITPEALPKYLEAVQKKMGVADFAVDKPKIALKLVTEQELDAIMTEHWRSNPNAYVNIYHQELTNKFIDYKIAFQNKESALAASRKADEQAAIDNLVENNNTKLAAKLESTSVTFTSDNVGPEIKSLKKSYEVDMEETVDNAIKILAAFVANKQACLAKLQVKKWFSLTPTQCAAALSKVKCDDNTFQPAGITFKEVEKL